jgi:hypothetical protein
VPTFSKSSGASRTRDDLRARVAVMRRLFFASLILTIIAAARPHALLVEALRSIGGLPPHIAGQFHEAVGFQQGPDGTYYVFDRRAHAVFAVNQARTAARTLVDIGQEEGRLIQPRGFDLNDDGRIAVADAPRNRHRIQVFDAAGVRTAGFYVPGQPAARVVLDNLLLNGTGSLHFAENRLLLSHPESGALVNLYTPAGYPTQTFGQLRSTGFEADRELHLAHNAGLPLADPTGGFYFVFITGRPMFRKYSADGTLLFERHVEGAEIDAFLEAQPTKWPRRRVEDREAPVVPPVIRTATVSPRGELWISMAVPYTYVYDRQGDKIRTVQFYGAGLMSPTSLAFSRTGTLLATPGCYEFPG